MRRKAPRWSDAMSGKPPCARGAGRAECRTAPARDRARSRAPADAGRVRSRREAQPLAAAARARVGTLDPARRVRRRPLTRRSTSCRSTAAVCCSPLPPPCRCPSRCPQRRRPAARLPNRPIKLVVAYPPGGGADLTARTVAQKMSEQMGQPVVVENRPGANGGIGADQVAKAAPDGYTIVLVDRGALGINAERLRQATVRPAEGLRVHRHRHRRAVRAGGEPQVAGQQRLKELIALAKAKPKSVDYGSFGIGSMAQLNLEAFNQRQGTDLQHVPYKGAGPAVQAVRRRRSRRGHRVGARACSASCKDGRLKAIAVGADQRLSAILPDVPTLAEAGAYRQTRCCRCSSPSPRPRERRPRSSRSSTRR